MLTQDQAQQKLDALKLKDGLGETRMLQRLRALKKPMRDIGFALRELDSDGLPLKKTARRAASDAANQAFIKLTQTQRLELFEALFGPALGPYAAFAYDLDTPYQVGYTRTAFRAPADLHLRQLTGWSWLWSVLALTEHYDQSLTWFAEHAGYLDYRADALGWLFAAAIDMGGETGQAIYDILTASADGTHPIGIMGRHVVRGLLVAARPDGWAVIEKLLLAAQRQEGLRQVILESIDECHPIAFRRMLHLILDHKLIRFSATLRALDVWLGYQLQVESAKRAEQVLAQLLFWLEHEAEREALLQNTNASPDPEQLYLALWSAAYTNAAAAAVAASHWLHHPRPEHRFVAVHLLGLLDLAPLTRPLLMVCLTDDDLAVCARAFRSFPFRAKPLDRDETSPTLYEQLEKLLARFPHDKTFGPVVWPWMKLSLKRSEIADQLIEALEGRPPKLLIPHLALMSPYRRGEVAAQLAKQKVWDVQTRQVLFKLMGDSASSAREKVFELLKKRGYQPSREEVLAVEHLLSRKTTDLRRAAIELLLRLPIDQARASAERLAASKSAEQRAASQEMLNLLNAHTSQTQALTLKDALGLMNPNARTPVVRPQPRRVKPNSDAAIACLKSLDALIDQHAQTLIQVPRRNWHVDEDEGGVETTGRVDEMPLGNALWQFPQHNLKYSLEDDAKRLPMVDWWEGWWRSRPKALRDTDGFELLRALTLTHVRAEEGSFVWYGHKRPAEHMAVIKAFSASGTTPLPRPKYMGIVMRVLEWLIRLHPVAGQSDYLLDVAEHSLALIDKAGLWQKQPAKGLVSKLMSVVQQVEAALTINVPGSEAVSLWSEEAQEEEVWQRQRNDDQLQVWLSMAEQAATFIVDWQPAHDLRLWQLLHWVDEPYPGMDRQRPDLKIVLKAWAAGAANTDDIVDQLLGERVNHGYRYRQFDDLQMLTGRKPHVLLKTYPQLQPLLEKCTARILEVELARGDLPTVATTAAMSIRSIEGIEVLLRLLMALDREGITRGHVWRAEGKSQVLSHLIRVSAPSASDTPQAFAERCKELHTAPQRLVELGVYAPQWARFVERALDWAGAAEGMWWLHAHTKERGWYLDQEMRAAWQAEISEFTPLKSDDLLDGAADVAWFRRVYAALGRERWGLVYDAARFASSGIGHTRARLFADAMLGELDEAELIQRIKTRRHQDSVRALGLLPIAGEGQEASSAVLTRYAVVQEFLRGAKQFGSQRQASEKLAARIGLQNLARSAGYADPIRLEWAMEIQTLGDLAQGPVTVSVDGATATLSISELGAAKLDIEKAGKPLKAAPATLKKHAQFVALKARQHDLVKQAARMRASLEKAMVRGDAFNVAELQTLFTHPIARVMLEQLVFVTIDGATLGYPITSGKLLSHTGERKAIGRKIGLRIAHPLDLLGTGEWHLWQQECYRNERIQPFKQVFREVYVPTRDEQTAADRSHRYAGHQVNPRQATALLSTRGWVVRMEEGVSHTFHDEGLVAWIDTNTGFLTPAEVEPPVIETVHFTRRGEWRSLPFVQVPPRLFSEVMRDVDLVVSVAHVGGVDPEASTSTIEMRTAMLHESCDLLKLSNVTIKGSHALIAGTLNRYSVHLGSAVVHQQPGGYLCIVPVHAQHRGRLFLPFMDNDPRTAEVLSKVLLLARDAEIKDPSVLEQIARVR